MTDFFILKMKILICSMFIAFCMQSAVYSAASDLKPEAVDQNVIGCPTYPLPLYNSLGKGICFFNAVMQILLQYPKFCEFIDKIDKPKNDFEKHLKNLRSNLKQFSCDVQLLEKYLINPAWAWHDSQIAAVRKQLIACSKKSCLGMYKEVGGFFGNSHNSVLVSIYLLLKMLFESEIKSFFYNREESTIFEVLDVVPDPENMSTDFDCKLGASVAHVQPFDGLDCSLLFICVPYLDLIAVSPFDRKTGAVITEMDERSFFKVVTCIEQILLENIAGKKCELAAIDFVVSRSIIPIQYSEDDKILYVKEVQAPCFAHAAAYVKNEGKWIFCDDFFREKLYQPMIREFANGLPDVFDDLVNREDGEVGMLFFKAS